MLASAKIIEAANLYEKIVSFYAAFTNIIILFLINSISKFEYIIDLALLLFLLQLIGILFLLLNRKTKYDDIS